MVLLPDKESNIMLKDIHCPYCNENGAILLSKTTSKKISLQLPAFGLKFLFSLFYLSIVHIFINGFKLIEAKKVINSISYAFCPNCGNTYSMAPPETIKAETHEPKFYRVEQGTVVMGLCKGISEYTGISLLWIRIITFLYALTIVGAMLYFLIGACVPFKENAENFRKDKKLYRVNNGKDILGLCKGFSEYTDIPVMWVRIFTVLLSVGVIGIFLYFILSAFIPVKENVEQGIERKKLYKTKDKKIILGLCSGISKYLSMPLWLVRVLAVLLFPLYFIVGAIVPTEEN